MAKKLGNKSQAIRDALAANPDKSPKEIAEQLTAEGYKVNAQYVSTIKSNAKIKSVRKVLRPKPSSTGSGDVMTATVDFIRAAGGLANAKAMLATVEEISALG